MAVGSVLEPIRPSTSLSTALRNIYFVPSPAGTMRETETAKDFSPRKFSPGLVGTEPGWNYRIRATFPIEELLFFHRLQEPINRTLSDLASVLDSLLDSFTEVNADKNPRLTVLFRRLREAFVPPQYL
jgi:hypothetical protein